MGRKCPSCSNSLSFYKFFRSCTEQSRPWACTHCGALLKQDFSTIRGPLLFAFAVAFFPGILVLGFGLRTPGIPTAVESAFGGTRSQAFLVAIAFVAVVAALLFIAVYILYRRAAIANNSKAGEPNNSFKADA